MDQDAGHQQQVGEGQHVELPEYEPVQARALDELGAQQKCVAMDVLEGSDTEGDDADQVGANLEESSDGDDVWKDLSWSSDEFDDDLSQVDPENYRELHRVFVRGFRKHSKSVYSFKPLRLSRCPYKTNHDVGEFPTARSGHRIVASESHLYSLGGYNPNRIPNDTRRDDCMIFQELWSFNLATNRWKLLLDADNSEIPRELASNGFVIYNNVLICHGGTGYPFGETCSNDCYVYKTGKQPQVMLLKVTGDLPNALFGQSIVIHNDYLYTIGGTNARTEMSCDVYRLNLLTMVWENVYKCRSEMRDDPGGCYKHEVVYDGHHIYILGGAAVYGVYGLKEIPAFNIETSRWDYFDTLPDGTAATENDPGYPIARKFFSCVQHTCDNGDIEAFITGGIRGGDLTHLNDIWKLNLRTKKWYKIHTSTLARPLYFHSAAHAGNSCMYIFGGAELGEQARRHNDVFKMWLAIPKLSDICWDAVTHYNGSLHKFDRSTLLKAGIPKRYVKRLPQHVPITDEPTHMPSHVE